MQNPSFKEKKIYIHIGLPKTASTFLQLRLFPKLKNDQIFYSQDLSRILTEIIRADEKSEDKIKELYSKIEKINSQTILISNETFFGSYFNNYDNFNKNMNLISEIFPQANIIVVLRNQIDWLSSIYKQFVRQGGVVSFNRFLNFRNNKFNLARKTFYKNINALDFDWGEKTDYLNNVFGQNNVKVLFYENLAKEPERFLLNLENILGTSVGNVDFSIKVKKGFSLPALRTARFLNLVWRPFVRLAHRLSGRKLDNVFDSVSAAAITEKIFRKRSGQNLKIIDDKKKILIDHYSQLNEKIAPYFKNSNLKDYYIS